MLAAQIPARPSAPRTTRSASNVVIEWDLPDNGGSAITEYTIEILEENGLAYAVDPHCDGTLAAVRDFRTCSVPITSLMAPPFTLPWGAAVVATVTARNSYGPSLVSPPTASGQRAIILRSPDAPLSLANNLQVTFGTRIGLTWSAGQRDGGTPVTDYTLWSDQGSMGSSYQPVVSGLASTSFTVTGLSLGTWYIFKVQATNAYGTSDYSSTLRVLAAQQPNIPLSPETLFLRDSVQVTWTEPFNGGSAVTGYQVQLLQSDNSWSENTVDCNQKFSTALTCTIPV